MMFKPKMDKVVYFVRHGESEGNVGSCPQLPTTPLTEKGRQQAKNIANRANNLPFEIIVSSTMTRARETAEEISKETGKPIEYSDLFIERQPPLETCEQKTDNPEILQTESSTIENFHTPQYQFSNKEDFEHLKKHAEAALAYLLQRPEEKILVVTHGFLMRIIMAQLIFGAGLTIHECEQCIKKFYMANTGLTIISYDKNDWWLWTWNDHTHLG